MNDPDLERRLSKLPADAWTPADLPPLDRGRALTARPPVRARPRRDVRLSLPLAALACVALLAAGAGGGRLLRGGADEPDGRVVPLFDPASQADPPRGEATISSSRVFLDLTGLEPTDADVTYEVWLLRSRDELVSLGTFRAADGSAQVDFPLGVDPARFPILDISREPLDGDPRHSSDSVLRSKPLA